MEAFARNHKIPTEWAEKGLRKEDHVLPALRPIEKRGAYGVYFIFKSMEPGRTFRITVPKSPPKIPTSLLERDGSRHAFHKRLCGIVDLLAAARNYRSQMLKYSCLRSSTAVEQLRE